MFKKIVVGFDGSGSSENAIRLACDLSEKYTSEIHILHTPKAETVAFAMGAVSGYHAATTMPSLEEVRKTARTMSDAAVAIAKDCGQAKAVAHIGSGDPAQDLLDCAESCGADLIVTGRRGLGNLSAMVLGSTSQKIGHLARCAHLTVM